MHMSLWRSEADVDYLSQLLSIVSSVSHMNLKLTDSATLPSQLALGILSLALTSWDYRQITIIPDTYMGVGKFQFLVL